MTKVLVVDDQVGVQMLLQEIFKSEGYQVEAAEDGLKAVEKTKEFLPDLIVMDMQMPHMNGLDASSRILEQKPEQKIILMTAFGEEDIIQKAQSIGIKRCVQKPFDIFQFAKEVKQVLE